MIGTQTGACFRPVGIEGEPRVRLRLSSHGCGMLAALAAAAALAGCGEFDTQQAWFSKPFDLAGHNSGYTFSELQETKQHKRAIAANDLVSSNGTCAPQPMAAAPPAPSPAAAGQAAAPVPPAQTAAGLLGAGIALGMSECDVVFRAGPPSAVQIGNNPNGDRTAVLTYNEGPRPGIYRFLRGELAEMDRVETPAPPPTQTVKKKSAKSAKSNKPQKKNDQS